MELHPLGLFKLGFLSSSLILVLTSIFAMTASAFDFHASPFEFHDVYDEASCKFPALFAFGDSMTTPVTHKRFSLGNMLLVCLHMEKHTLENPEIDSQMDDFS